MKILFVLTRSDVIGGASVHLHDLAAGMESRGHTVRVLVGGEGMFLKRLLSSGVDAKGLKNLKREINLFDDINCFFELKREVQLFSPDLLHLHSSKAGIIGRLIANHLNVPNIFTAHGWSFTEGVPYLKGLVYKYLERYSARFSSQIITVSEFDRQLALKNCICKSKLITTIRNGVKDKTCEVEGSESESVKLIMVARFDQQKNHVMLIEALNKIKELPFDMTFVGDGPLLEEVKERTRILGLSQKITFLGARNDVDILLSQSDVFVLISNWEGLPLTILEAMSHSLPILASNVGGVSETINNNKEGFLITRNGNDELTNALSKLISDKGMRKKLGISARKRYEDNFQIKQMLDSTECLYFDVIEGYNES